MRGSGGVYKGLLLQGESFRLRYSSQRVLDFDIAPGTKAHTLTHSSAMNKRPANQGSGEKTCGIEARGKERKEREAVEAQFGEHVDAWGKCLRGICDSRCSLWDRFLCHTALSSITGVCHFTLIDVDYVTHISMHVILPFLHHQGISNLSFSLTHFILSALASLSLLCAMFPRLSCRNRGRREDQTRSSRGAFTGTKRWWRTRA